MTGEQVRAARAMLGIEQAELAQRAGVSVKTIKRFEATHGKIDGHAVWSVKNALELAGIEFLEGEHFRGKGEGVRFCVDRTAKLRRKIIDDMETRLDISMQLAVEKDEDFFERSIEAITEFLLSELNRSLVNALQSALKKDN